MQMFPPAELQINFMSAQNEREDAVGICVNEVLGVSQQQKISVLQIINILKTSNG